MSNWLHYRVDKDFSRARRRAFLHSAYGVLRRQSTALLPLEDVRARVLIRGQSDLGMQTVPLDRIVGSEGRYHDFDRMFLPRSGKTQQRWKSIGRAYYEDIILPPVELYKLGEVYFVRDGNHRVSVARQRGQVDIDAHVVELKTDVSLTPDLSLSNLILKEEESDFLHWTGLAELRPDAHIEISEPGGYLELIRHINGHRYFLSLERDQEVTVEEAVGHWYDEVYLPLIAAIRRSGILGGFPGRTEADLYLWIMEHRHYLTEQMGTDPGTHEAVHQYVSNFGPRRARRQAKQKVTPEEQAFLRWSGLERGKPGVGFELGDTTSYATLKQHIVDHQYYLAQERQASVGLEEAALSWYEHIYRPVLDTLSQQRTRGRFPNQTPADLYLLVMSHLSYLRESGVEIDPAAAAADYATQFGASRMVCLVGALHGARRLLGKAIAELGHRGEAPSPG